MYSVELEYEDEDNKIWNVTVDYTIDPGQPEIVYPNESAQPGFPAMPDVEEITIENGNPKLEDEVWEWVHDTQMDYLLESAG